MTLAFELARLLAGRRPERSRAPSVVVTVFGDAILPRGGSVGLATLSAILGGLGIGDGALRTAASRLVADGWLERSRAGRLSFFRLSPRGAAVFRRATRHIYDPPEPTWSGRLALHWPESPDPARWREAGFGEAAPGLWIAPAAVAPPAPGSRLEAEGPMADMAGIAARAWPLGALAQSYAAFAATYRPLLATLATGADPLPALLLRVLLIHDYRRVILRDPLLPPALLPADWPGFAARDLCGALYRAVLPASEAWLDAHGRTEEGPLPRPGPDLATRFATRYTDA